MLPIEAKLTGDLEGALDRFEKAVREKILRSGAAATAEVFYVEAQSNASRNIKSGTLFRAIYRFLNEEKSTPYRVTYQISWNHTKAPHGGLIEWGTSRAPAYPFMRPAWDRADAAIDTGLERMRQRMAEGAA